MDIKVLPCSTQTCLARKSPINGGFNVKQFRKINYRTGFDQQNDDLKNISKKNKKNTYNFTIQLWYFLFG